MKKFFLTMFSAVLAVSFLGCEKAETSNQNAAANISVQANAETADANVNNNTNTSTPIDAPVPTFTDEKTAIAEGNKLLDNNQTEKAIEAYNQAVKLNPESGEGYYRLGIAHLTLENEKEAAQVNEEADPTPTPKGKAKPKKSEKNTVEIPDTEWAKSFQKAIGIYEKYVKKNPKDDVAFFNLGRSYNKINKDREAEKALREAAKLKPEDGQYQTEHGAILVKLAQYDQAIPVLKKAVKIDDGNLQAQELLEKAEAGKKRIDFGAQQKAKQIVTQMQNQPIQQRREQPTQPKRESQEQPKKEPQN